MWLRVSGERARGSDIFVPEVGKGGGEPEGEQEHGTVYIPDPSRTSHSREADR